MKDQRFNPFAQLMSLVWAVLFCAVVLTIAVNLLREIWPWLLGITAVILVAIGALRLVAFTRSRQW